jgi:hypothetical protein
MSIRHKLSLRDLVPKHTTAFPQLRVQCIKIYLNSSVRCERAT